MWRGRGSWTIQRTLSIFPHKSKNRKRISSRRLRYRLLRLLLLLLLLLSIRHCELRWHRYRLARFRTFNSSFVTYVAATPASRSGKKQKLVKRSPFRGIRVHSNAPKDSRLLPNYIADPSLAFFFICRKSDGSHVGSRASEKMNTQRWYVTTYWYTMHKRTNLYHVVLFFIFCTGPYIYTYSFYISNVIRWSRLNENPSAMNYVIGDRAISINCTIGSAAVL